MKYRFKVGLTSALVCGLPLGIAACGGGGDDSDTGSSGETVAPSELSGTITVWDFVSGSFAAYDPVNEEPLAEFEKYPDITVDHVPQPFEGFEPAYQAAFTLGKGRT